VVLTGDVDWLSVGGIG